MVLTRLGQLSEIDRLNSKNRPEWKLTLAGDTSQTKSDSFELTIDRAIPEWVTMQRVNRRHKRLGWFLVLLTHAWSPAATGDFVRGDANRDGRVNVSKNQEMTGL